LEPAGQIRLGLLAGEKASMKADPVLSWDALNQPIEGQTDDADTRADDASADILDSKPRIPGYAVLEEIGRGGQGSVYRALQESTDRIVAIKVMTARAGPRHRTRIEREAKLLASLRHPGIVRIIDRGQTSSGLFYLVMEFIEGRQLDEYWANCLPPGPDGTRRLLQLFIDLADAIGEAHSHGIVHRDLKPSNVRVTASGTPCVLDFGLARAIAGTPSRVVTTTGQILGSLPWASPEQAGGINAQIGAPTDVYSLGLMMYHAFSGRPPYPVDGSLLELMLHIASTVPCVPSRIPGGRPIGPALDRVIARAIAKNPQDRYSSGKAIAGELRAALNEKFSVSHSAPTRRWLVAAALSVAMCIVATGHWGSGNPQSSMTPAKIFPMQFLTNSLGMRLIRIPAGQFVMGSPTGEAGRAPTEQQRLVKIASTHFVGSTEVTQQEFKKVMGFNPSDPRWLDPEMPVENVTWDEAKEFCRRLSKTEGRRYRLPTSEEWEYACRAHTLDAFGGSSSVDAVGWYSGNSGGNLHAVGAKQPNTWGLCDMHGNVAEWVSDDVQDVNMSQAVVRGGSFLRSEAECRAGSTNLSQQKARFCDIGFRVLLDP
jgi:serine/threonine protein kinase